MKVLLFAIVFSLLIGTLSIWPNQTLAQSEASDSADQIQENIKQRIQKTVQENTARIKGLTTGSNRKVVWGKIQRISEGSMSLETTKGTQIITFTEEVKLYLKSKEITIKDIEIDNEAVVYGEMDGEDFVPEKIEIHQTSLTPSARKISLGNIREVSRTSLTIVPRGTDQSEIYSFQKNSTYQQLNGEDITLADLDEGLDVLVIANPTTTSSSVKNSSGAIVLLRLLAEVKQ